MVIKRNDLGFSKGAVVDAKLVNEAVPVLSNDSQFSISSIDSLRSLGRGYLGNSLLYSVYIKIRVIRG